MTDEIPDSHSPTLVALIEESTRAHGFTMASDSQTGSLLRTLAVSKPGGVFLELGTGTGLSAAWILSGMDASATLLTVDNDPAVVKIAEEFLGHDTRLSFHIGDGGAFISELRGRQFDFVFADAWPGKYTHLNETLTLVKPGGFYIVDDMLPQPNWPADHPPKVATLIDTLVGRDELHVTKLSWSSGIILCTKRS